MPPPCTRIVVLVPSDRVRRWAVTVAEHLRARFNLPTALRQSGTATPRRLPSESFERRLFAVPQPDHTSWICTRSIPALEDESLAESLVINLTELAPGDILSRRPSFVLTPTFNGKYSADALIGSLHRQEAPHLGLLAATANSSCLLHGAHLTMHDRNLVLPALNAVLARAITILTQASDHLLADKPLPKPCVVPAERSWPSDLRFWFGRIAQTYPRIALHNLTAPFVHTGDWCVAYRRSESNEVPNVDLNPATFSILPCDYGRFYADPILFRHNGSTTIFFEDYDYATARGRISYVSLSAEGRSSEPREALTRPYHLSYPFVFSNGDDTFMIPETSANRTVELYQAEAFPDRWKLRSILMHGIEVADATPFFDERSGLWWLFGTVTELGSSSYDSLSVFFSESLDGPWHPHAMNPVKFDPSSSRPAGPLVGQEGRLLRPAQDSTHGYGSGLAWCEIKELTPNSFHEEVVARLFAPAGYQGVHTYSRGGGFEAIDYQRRRWRLM